MDAKQILKPLSPMHPVAYRPASPYRKGYLAVGDGHKLYYD